MDKITLDVTEGKYATVKEARQAKRIPIAYYGKGVDNIRSGLLGTTF